MSSQDKDGFIRVTRRGRGNRRQETRMQQMTFVEPIAAEDPGTLWHNDSQLQALKDSLAHMVAHCITVREEKCEIPKEDVLRRVEKAIDHLNEDDYFRSFEKVLDQALLKLNGPIEKIVCYALGTFSCTMSARYQLAFLVLLKKKFQVEVEVYDPGFLETEEEVMQENFGFKILTVNEEGKRDVGETQTLFFLPHAPHQLTNNVVFANWNYTSLNKAVLICNSFANLRENNFPGSEISTHFSYINRSEKVVEEYGIINTFTYLDVFNDMAIHIFPHYKFGGGILPNDFWDNSFVPVYGEVDFITAKRVK